MKRGLAALLLLLALLTLGACSRGAIAKPMRLKAVELTKQEKNLFDMMKEDRTAALYDFLLDAPATAINVHAYELTADGTWSELEGLGSGLLPNAKRGRVYISFKHIWEGMTLAVQDDDGSASVRTKLPESKETQEPVATAVAAAEYDVVWEKEIPLALQIVAPGEQSVSLSVEYYDRPEELMNQGYSAVYMVTAKFSKEPQD